MDVSLHLVLHNAIDCSDMKTCITMRCHHALLFNTVVHVRFVLMVCACLCWNIDNYANYEN